MEWLDRRLHDIPVLDTSLVDRRYLISRSRESLPPIRTLDRHVVRTSDKSIIDELSRDTSSFWFRWMCDVEEEEGHRFYVKN